MGAKTMLVGKTTVDHAYRNISTAVVVTLARRSSRPTMGNSYMVCKDCVVMVVWLPGTQIC